MNEILKWLSTYSWPIVLLLVIGAGFIYFVKKVTERAISNQFDRHKKVMELELERRSGFEEKILLDRYLMIRKLQTRIGNVMTSLNRIKHEAKLEGVIVNKDIVPLTEVFGMLSVNKYLITEKFHRIFWDQAHIAIQFANEKDEYKLKQLEDQYVLLLDKFYKEINKTFNLESIKWKL